MRNLILSFWAFLKSIFLQIILGLFAYESWEKAEKICTDVKHTDAGRHSRVGLTFVTSGFDGGAIAMGLIACACIIGIVWLEVNKSKKSE